MGFSAYGENALSQKIRLISKFMTSHPHWQRTTIHMLLNISRIKGNQTMKFGQLIEYPKRNIFLYKLCRNRGRETSFRPLFGLLKSFILGKIKWSAAWFSYISMVLRSPYNRNKLFEALHYQSRDILNFFFLDKGLRITFPAHFVYDFSTKMFLMLY